mmetsp:Transcript_24592/g.51092  ORF Transcript_24592/g.51092 Transcript_24592/m.51092 type:complete len:207 (+) Transcript_24592:279-899(+)
MSLGHGVALLWLHGVALLWLHGIALPLGSWLHHAVSRGGTLTLVDWGAGNDSYGVTSPGICLYRLHLLRSHLCHLNGLARWPCNLHLRLFQLTALGSVVAVAAAPAAAANDEEKDDEQPPGMTVVSALLPVSRVVVAARVLVIRFTLIFCLCSSDVRGFATRARAGFVRRTCPAVVTTAGVRRCAVFLGALMPMPIDGICSVGRVQ